MLPTGAFVPHDIPGNCLKNCVEEWHHCNCGELAAAQMLYNVMSNEISDTLTTSRFKVEATPTLIATCHSHPNIFDSHIEPEILLSTNDRIASLERKLFQLRGCKEEPPVRTRAQHAAEKSKL